MQISSFVPEKLGAEDNYQVGVNVPNVSPQDIFTTNGQNNIKCGIYELQNILDAPQTFSVFSIKPKCKLTQVCYSLCSSYSLYIHAPLTLRLSASGCPVSLYNSSEAKMPVSINDVAVFIV